MEIVDAQVHANHRGLEPSVAIMDALGVTAAIIDVWPPERTKLPNGVNRYTYKFAEEAVSRFPERFAYVVRFDPSDKEVEDQVAQVRQAPNRLCIRIASGLDIKALPSGAHEHLLSAAAKYDVPVMIFAGSEHGAMQKYIEKFERVQFIIDHVGMAVRLGGQPDPLETTIDRLISYAKYPHVAVKWGHAPRLSRQPFPYRDLIAQLRRVIDEFGVKRLMWASDYTVTTDNHTCGESLFCIRCSDQLSETDKEWLLGRSAREILRWPKSN
jgi:predicted TIM-barrel fold metal-dependent hydrolase